MALVSEFACLKRKRGFATALLALALPASLIGADRNALLNPDSSLLQGDSNLLQSKDFLKRFSAKDFLKQPIPPVSGKGGPLLFLNPRNPQLAIVLDGAPKCSIPPLENHVARNPDPKGVIKPRPGRIDSIAGRNPAPVCRNWNEKSRWSEKSR